MQSLERILRERKGGISFGNLADLHRVRVAWADVVGGSVASKTFVHSIKNGRLLVCAEGSAWLTELQFRRETILKALKRITASRVCQVQFRVASIKPSR